MIDLGAIAELTEIAEQGNALRIGSGVSLARIAAHPAVRGRLPALAQAAASVAGATHRVAASLGGYLCLGHTESMSRISSRFDVRRFEAAVVFQRAELARGR